MYSIGVEIVEYYELLDLDIFIIMVVGIVEFYDEVEFCMFVI